MTDLAELSEVAVKGDLSALSEEDLKFLFAGLQKKAIEAARDDVDLFIALHFGKPQHPMHAAWQQHITDHQRCFIAAMRGCGKSTQITELRTVWELGRDPNIRVKLVSVSQNRSKKFVSGIQKHITQCHICRSVFPGLKKDPSRSWTATRLNVLRPEAKDVRDDSVEAWGVTSSPEGGRAEILIFDDITSLQTSVIEPQKGKSIKEAFQGTWLDVKAGPNTRYWYLCTLWSTDDASMAVMNTPGWEAFVYSISDDFSEIDVNKKYGNPKYQGTFPLPMPSSDGEWTEDALRDEYATRGAFFFNRSMRNDPVDQSTRIFAPELFYGSDDPDLDMPGAVRYGLSRHNEAFDNYPRYAGVDLGIAGTKTNKPSVISTIAVSDGSGPFDKGTRILLDVQRGKWTSPDTARRIVECYSDYRHDVIMVENNFYQQALIEWIEDVGGASIPIEPHHTGSQKMKIDQGIPLLAAEFERGLWVIPMLKEHEMGCSCNFCQLIREAIEFTPQSGGRGSHTDTLLATWMAQRAAKQAEDFSGGFGIFEL